MSNRTNGSNPNAQGYKVGAIAELELHFPTARTVKVQIVEVQSDIFGSGKTRIYAQELGKVGPGNRTHVGYPEHFKLLGAAA